MSEKINLYPGTVMVKAFIHEDEKAKKEIIAIVKNAFPRLSDNKISSQHSANKKYLCIRFEIEVDEEKSIQDLYQTLSQHPDIKMVL